MGATEPDTCTCAPNHALGFTVHEPPCQYAAPEPDAGDVEALAVALMSAVLIPGPVRVGKGHAVVLADDEAHDAARRMTDWLAAHDAEVARTAAKEAGERIAQAIEARRDRIAGLDAKARVAFDISAEYAREEGRAEEWNVEHGNDVPLRGHHLHALIPADFIKGEG